MRHVIWLGVRGVLLEFSGALLRIFGAMQYRRLLSRGRANSTIGLRTEIE